MQSDPQVGAKLRAATGLAHLQHKKYKLAGRAFMEVGTELGTSFSDVIAQQVGMRVLRMGLRVLRMGMRVLRMGMRSLRMGIENLENGDEHLGNGWNVHGKQCGHNLSRVGREETVSAGV